MMIPRKPQEGPRADGARRAPPLVTRSPVGGDTAGQRKEGEYLLPGQVGPCDHGCGDGRESGNQRAISLATWARESYFSGLSLNDSNGSHIIMEQSALNASSRSWWVRIFRLQVTETG